MTILLTQQNGKFGKSTQREVEVLPITHSVICINIHFSTTLALFPKRLLIIPSLIHITPFKALCVERLRHVSENECPSCALSPLYIGL